MEWMIAAERQNIQVFYLRLLIKATLGLKTLENYWVNPSDLSILLFDQVIYIFKIGEFAVIVFLKTFNRYLIFKVLFGITANGCCDWGGVVVGERSFSPNTCIMNRL